MERLTPKTGFGRQPAATTVTPLASATPMWPCLNGLALATLSEISLIRIIQGSAGIPLTKRKGDRIKICATPNFVIISTPVEEHVPLYLNAITLNIQGKDHSFNAHVAAPAGTSVGIIHGIPLEDSPDTVLSTLQQHNPNVPILSTRRLGATGCIQVLPDGSQIPFWLAYDGAQRRCTPFRHRREACTNRWSTGHRRDVCPNPATSRCLTCGLEHPEPGHACTPKCIVCHEVHPTGHPSCSQRFQKRRRLPGPQETGQKAKFRNLTSTVDTGKQEPKLSLEASPTPFPPIKVSKPQPEPIPQPLKIPLQRDLTARSKGQQRRKRQPQGQQASSLGDLGSNQQRRTHKVSWAEAARAAPPKHTPTPLPSPSNSSYQIELAGKGLRLLPPQAQQTRRMRCYQVKFAAKGQQGGMYYLPEGAPVTKSAALTSVEDPSRVHRMQVRKCSARSAVGVGYDRQGRRTPVFLRQRPAAFPGVCVCGWTKGESGGSASRAARRLLNRVSPTFKA
ncbi:hypothetical protein HPB47_017272 [Ixodes persulcatus]|uniref:Uncharacterized protein n=1 Tax=Ixodes persulcatus TaxID=34615 RepID=A0AC60QR44_IXOPE|nr:hypothetical protein HPB47_017272 [Ixodes persulcatus]